MPGGHIFTDEGQGVVPTGKVRPLYLLGYLNSSLVAYFLNLTSGLQKHYVYVRPVPVINVPTQVQHKIETSAGMIVSIKQVWDATSEISPLFQMATLKPSASSSESIASISSEAQNRRIQDSLRISEERSKINDLVFTATSLGREDIDEIQALLATYPADVPNIDGLLASPKTEASEDVAQAITSYLFGAAFGRWDIRYATGERSTVGIA